MKCYLKTLVSVSLLIGVWGFAEEAPATTLTATKDANGRDAFKLSNGKLEAIVIPSLGRVMSFSQAGGSNWLWNAPADRIVLGGWNNYGGEKAWVSPQAEWPLYIGHGFPPDEVWESGHRAEMLDHPARLRTTSGVSKCGIQIIREFAFNSAGEFVTTTTLEKKEGEALIAGAWTVTQVTPPDAIFLPTSETSAYKNNVYTWDHKPHDNVSSLTPTLLRVIPAEKGAYKIGVDSPVAAIAAVRDGIAFVQRADKENAKYPDGAEESGFPVEVFDLGGKDLHYLELELLSPIATLAKGQRRTFVVRWSIHQLPSRDVNSAETRTAVDNLLHAK